MPRSIFALGIGAALLFLLSACERPNPSPGPAPKPPAASAKPAAAKASEWLKGQTHLHSNRSGDSQTPPEEVVAWYAKHGYDFIVFTDHDFITDPPAHPTLLALPGVELTQNSRDCQPPPLPGRACLLHVNALFVEPPDQRRIVWPRTGSKEREAIYGRALALTRELGGLAQINHPNFHYGADGALITSLAMGHQPLLLEIANEAVDSNNAGDKAHPSTEALWDRALSAGARVYGVATDDAHHYNDAQAVRARGEMAYEGDRGFVMVRAARDPASIRKAMEEGRFYSSNGLILADVRQAGGSLHVMADPKGPAVTITFIGKGGKVLATHQGHSASHKVPGAAAGDYLRAVVSDPQGKKAWVQPVSGRW